MEKVFQPCGYFTVPDDTEVSPFLNATDTNQNDVPWDALRDMSIAAGRIRPGITSWIHYHPVLSQVTYVVAGKLTVRMKGPRDTVPYSRDLTAGQAAVTEPGTLFQLQNSGNEVVQVLYIVSPAYVFEKQGGDVVYDDAVLVARTWQEIPALMDDQGLPRVSRYDAWASRAEAVRRIAKSRGIEPPLLAEETVRSLPEPYDYLAPDGSQIRLLAGGERGGTSHCLLPAGKISAPVCHRTVEELWYVLEGDGEIWRARAGEKRVDELHQGDSVRIPVDTAFQFRAGAAKDLKLLIATIPAWPGPQEAVEAGGAWPVSAGREEAPS